MGIDVASKSMNKINMDKSDLTLLSVGKRAKKAIIVINIIT
jgi:hypothetical protein